MSSGRSLKNIMPFKSFTAASMSFTAISMDHRRLKITSGNIACVLEKVSTDVYAISDVISNTISQNDVNGRSAYDKLMKMRFMIWSKTTIIPLEKKYQDSTRSSGYWGLTPNKLGEISEDKQIRAYKIVRPGTESEGYMLQYHIANINGTMKCVCEYSRPLSARSTKNMVGKTEKLSYFGL